MPVNSSSSEREREKKMEQARPMGKEIKVEYSGGSGSSGTGVAVTVAAAEFGGIEGEMKAGGGEEMRSVWEKPKAHVIIDLIRKNDENSEFMLGRLLEEVESHGFYCPNCNAPIKKVNVVRRDIEDDPPRRSNDDDRLLKCTSCFTFLQLIGDRLVSICNPGRDPKSPDPNPKPAPKLTQDPDPNPIPEPKPTPDPNMPAKKWDILKSIVYGGLIESITSLSIVTSAAGADATTLKILALGLANLIGGLFVIGHNLIEVRNDKADHQNGGGGGGDGESSDHQRRRESREEGDGRYERELGERENFKRHAAVVVLSFLLFGLVAPVTYGFSFLKSDDKELKLVAVAAASLICITMLAIAKAYILKASTFFGYLKIVLNYVIPGFMASGLSYVVAHLIKNLLQKLGLFDSSSTSSNYSVFITDHHHHPYLSLPGTSTAQSGWGF